MAAPPAGTRGPAGDGGGGLLCSRLLRKRNRTVCADISRLPGMIVAVGLVKVVPIIACGL